MWLWIHKKAMFSLPPSYLRSKKLPLCLLPDLFLDHPVHLVSLFLPRIHLPSHRGEQFVSLFLDLGCSFGALTTRHEGRSFSGCTMAIGKTVPLDFKCDEAYVEEVKKVKDCRIYNIDNRKKKFHRAFVKWYEKRWKTTSFGSGAVRKHVNDVTSSV